MHCIAFFIYEVSFMTDITLENIKCHIEPIGCGGPVVFWGMANRGDDAVSAVISYLHEAGVNCVLFAFEVSDWNSDFSPWAMHTDDFDFAGCGNVMLSWLKAVALPCVQTLFPENDTYIIAGYSLSGLFAIWSFYEIKLFRGLVCCSASLWFEGWESYAAAACAPCDSIVYLSLGGKEADSPNSLMASIGSKYKTQEKFCKADKNITKTVFEMNSGGHFANPPKRISKGIIRILKELQG